MFFFLVSTFQLVDLRGWLDCNRVEQEVQAMPLFAGLRLVAEAKDSCRQSVREVEVKLNELTSDFNLELEKTIIHGFVQK